MKLAPNFLQHAPQHAGHALGNHGLENQINENERAPEMDLAPKFVHHAARHFWGKVHLWGSLIFMNLIFQPMFAQGMAGMLRRMADGGANYSQAKTPHAIGGPSAPILGLHTHILLAARGPGPGQIPFIINLFWSMKNGAKVTSDNPWDATTLEWQAPTPPPHGNFDKPSQVHRGPYEYSVPGHVRDFTPQNEAD